MVEPRKYSIAPTGGAGPHRLLMLLLVLLGSLTLSARAALQFDVFLGYDGVVSEASWFPVVCEVKNDGPSFNGTIEVSSGSFNQNQTRRMVVELPTGTLKRLVIPVFSSARYQSRWDVRLLDERGRVRAEQLAVQPKRQLSARTVVMGALPRSAGGVPVIRQILSRETDIQPSSARLQPALIPDNPLVFEGLDSFYLNSEKAMELTANQIEALLAWLNNGGHLIVAVEQVADVNSTPWLRKLVPCNLTEQQTANSHLGLQQWVRGAPKTNEEAEATSATQTPQSGRRKLAYRANNGVPNPFGDLTDDAAFEAAPLQVAVGTPRRDGQVLATAGNLPLVITSNQGRGRVTVLLFSPEREPARSWKNLPSFWAKLADVPSVYYSVENNNQRGGWSADGIFGAMIDSKQVRKLPVEWLLLLLLVYLVVIGPLDQYWLKRIKRPMLTWVTFPCYVVLFSLLIYFIGYKLRAGESEWNELHLVDVLVRGEGAELRGHTYASIYSPVNAKYKLESQQKFSTFRGEFQSSWSGGQDGERADVLQNGDNFKAEIFVPVWTSQLYVSDWWNSAPMPLDLSVTDDGLNYVVKVQNKLDRPLAQAQLVVANRVLEIGELPVGQIKTFRLARDKGVPLRDFVSRHGGNFQQASQSRQHAFGASGSGQISDLPNSCMAASFLSQLSDQQNSFNFITPPGLDLTDLMERGNAVLLAWSADYSPVKPMNQFSPRRSHKDTLWRMSVPVNA
ncbi:MAG: hypothetical protein JWR69_4738, partial [Pedosphaera sp.]|nr:hypothetical protein [Pedosphaera sp.]